MPGKARRKLGREGGKEAVTALIFRVKISLEGGSEVLRRQRLHLGFEPPRKPHLNDAPKPTPPAQIPLRSPAADRSVDAACAAGPVPVGDRTQDALGDRLPVRSLRARDVGEAVSARRIFHKLRKYSRRNAGVSC